ncbi:MFS transporter [Microbacterium sp. NPDC077663]|uniref:MFS transporter n=1 Tax=Microbacterium sp. NPDC077663 TaxID=3364189 RepID=UPI0037CC509F
MSHPVPPFETTAPSPRRWLLLAVVSAGLLLITLDNSILYTALPTLTRELDASATESLWIINAYPLVMAGLLLGSGTLGDRIGHRRMFLIGLVVFGLASAAAAFAPTAAALIAARALLAVGAAAMMPSTLALIRVTFHDERERNIAIAVWGSVSVLGIALGPIVSGLLLEFFWWGSVFLVNVPVVLAAVIATLLVTPASTADRSKRWDAVSSAQAMIALTAAVVLIKELAHTPPNGIVVAISASAAVFGFWLFARRQRRLTEPLLEFSIFRNPAFASGVLAAVVAMFALAGVQLITTQRFQLIEGLSPLHSGLLVAIVALGSLPSGLIGGAILHRAGLRMIISGGFAVALVGTIATLFGVLGPMWLLLVGLAVMGAGFGATMSVASTAIVGNVARRRAGMASAVEEVSYEFGSLVAVALLGSLVSLVYSTSIQLPDGAPPVAAESLLDAVSVGAGDPALLAAAATAFDAGSTSALAIIALVVAAATVTTARLLRRHGPGTSASQSSEPDTGR